MILFNNYEGNGSSSYYSSRSSGYYCYEFKALGSSIDSSVCKSSWGTFISCYHVSILFLVFNSDDEKFRNSLGLQM